MSRPDEELQPGPVPEREPEPRLLTRPDRVTPNQPTGTRGDGTRSDRPQRRAVRVAARPRNSSNRRTSRRFTLAARLALVCVVLAILAGLGMVLDLRHTLTASLPQIDGSVRIAGLAAPVTVTRDPQGVPSITASSLDDLLFAQGYVTAGDRLWQMDALRRHAAGDLAEILGPSLIEHDRRQRYLQIRAAADRALAQLPPDQVAQLQAYARGVNAYIDAHTGTLPIEFRMLAYKPAPWSPRDSLLVSLAMWQDLSTEFPRKMDREVLSAHLPPDLLPDLYPVGSWRDQPPTAQNRDLTAPHEVEQIPLDPSQSHVERPAPIGPAPRDMLAVSNALAGADRCDGCRSGSNNWAVSGMHTASGAPMVANDMHLSLAIPDIWYEASLHADIAAQPAGGTRLDVTGFTLPGAPFVIVGRNPRVAWSVTNLGADVQDLRIEHLRGSGSQTEYERPDGTWTLANHRSEAIRVRGGRDVVLDVLTTTHQAGAASIETPIISPLYRGERRALSLAWTAYDPTALELPFLATDTAQDGASLVSALSTFGGPSLNLVWADTAGHIGYHALGRIPVRGPAIQHPRAMQLPPVVPLGTVPEDEGSQEPDGPQASLTAAAHLVLSAYEPARRTRLLRERRRPHEQRATQPSRKRSRPKAEQQSSAQQEPAAPVPPSLNYTIGSPISPVPVDALDESQAWTGYIPFEALPSVVDPSRGFLATANARVTPDDYPYAIADDWTDPFRVERIVHMLDGRRGLTPADMLRLQNDVHSDVNLALAQRVAYALDHASAKAVAGDPERLRQAANLLRAWDGEMTTTSSAAAIVTAVRTALWPALLVPQIMRRDGVDRQHAIALADLYTWIERATALELLVQNEPARWLPPGNANWNDLLARTTETALRTAQAPGDLARWHYGQMHKVEISHPIFGEHHLLSHLLGIASTTGPQPAPGDASTLKAIGAHFGPSERFTADLSSPEAALGNITTGESANPRSPWYLDQFKPWLQGSTFQLPSSSSEVTHTLTMVPR